MNNSCLRNNHFRVPIILVLVFSLFFGMWIPPAAMALPQSTEAPSPAAKPDVVEAPPFQDVPVNSPDFLFINYLVSRKLISGFPDGTYRPLEGLTRAQAAQVIAGVAKLPPVAEAAPFSDIEPGYWAGSAIAAARQAGMLNGFPDGTFRPDEPLTRAQAVVLLFGLDKTPLPDIKSVDYADIPEGHWARKQALAAVRAGVIRPAAEGFAPDKAFNRGDLARALAMLLTISPKLRSAPLLPTLTVKGGATTVTRKGEATEVVNSTTVREGDMIDVRSGAAELTFDDGTGIQLKPGARLTLSEARGRSYIKKTGRPGTTVESLKLDMPIGKIFFLLAKFGDTVRAEKQAGIPAGAALYAAAPGPVADGVPSFAGLPATALLAAADGTAKDEEEWWRTASEEKGSRMTIDLPWGVAAVQGTSGSASANADGTGAAACLEGSIGVSAGGQTATLSGLQQTSVPAPNAPPTPPAPASPQTKAEFAQPAVAEFIAQQAQQAVENAAAPQAAPSPAAPADAPAPAQTPTTPATQAAPANQANAVISALSAVGASVGSASSTTNAARSSTGSGGGGGGSTTPPPSTTTPITATVTDSTVTMQEITSSVQYVNGADNCWTIAVANGTVKADVKLSDLSIKNLPHNLIPVVSKAANANAIQIKVTGSCTPVHGAIPIGVVVKASAVTESGMGDSAPLNMELKPAPTQVNGDLTDRQALLNVDNLSYIDNQWVCKVNVGTVKQNISWSDLSINVNSMAFSAVSYDVYKGEANTIVIRVLTLPYTSLSEPAEVNVTVKSTAVEENGLSDSAPVKAYILPPGQIAVMPLHKTIWMDYGNRTVHPQERWVVEVIGATLRTVLSTSDVQITDLPAGLTPTVVKGPGNTVEVSLTGTMATALTQPSVTQGIIVKGSAIDGAGFADSAERYLLLTPNPFQVSGYASDDLLVMNPDNRTADCSDEWQIGMTMGQLRSALSPADLQIDGLPAGLTPTWVVEPDNVIGFSVSGTAVNPITSPVSVDISLRNSAVEEQEYITCSVPIRVWLVPMIALSSNPSTPLVMETVYAPYAAANKWVLPVATGVVHDGFSINDLHITGSPLPVGLTLSAEKGAGNTIALAVYGTADQAVTQPLLIIAAILGTGVGVDAQGTGPRYGDSAPIPLLILPAGSPRYMIASPNSVTAGSSTQTFTLQLYNETVSGTVAQGDITLMGDLNGLAVGNVANTTSSVTVQVTGTLTRDTGYGIITISGSKLSGGFALSAMVAVSPQYVTPQ
ncbi:hypothetical protein GTO91_09005 [Heliobacterium undosum]|uniref:SLH domain-containing protein n=1 Tax=Heliomicrobium undosum TaxID=121734 RepID=A0A845L4S0_9FIRM|nr:S-layer homology domain-containing protein [Heliomicrobium undosum]MZP29844.1 hypothetical protein [Heliomicrobium undosum]